MKQIKKLLIEYEIRFRDTDKIKEDGLTFGINSINQYIYKPTISVHSIWNTHGKVYLDGEWATADLKEVPEKWVVEKDENHPMWERFRESQISRNGAGIGFGYMYYNESHIFNDNLTYFTDHQFLTLDQWAKFFLPKIDFSIINNKDWFYVKSLSDGYLIKGGIKIQNDRLTFNEGYWISTKYLLRDGKFFLNKIIEFRKANDCELGDLFNNHPACQGNWTKIDFSIINDEDWFFLKGSFNGYLIKGNIRALKEHFSQKEYLMYDKIYNIPLRHLKNGDGFMIEDITEFRLANKAELDNLFNKYPELISPKTGDWGLFYDDIGTEIHEIKKHGSIEIRELKSFSKNRFILKCSRVCWNHFFPIDLTKPIKDEINRFLEFAKSDYRL